VRLEVLKNRPKKDQKKLKLRKDNKNWLGMERDFKLLKWNGKIYLTSRYPNMIKRV